MAVIHNGYNKTTQLSRTCSINTAVILNVNTFLMKTAVLAENCCPERDMDNLPCRSVS